jgi:hypothetical protein
MRRPIADVRKQLAQDRAEAQADATRRDAALEAASARIYARLLEAESRKVFAASCVRRARQRTTKEASAEGGRRRASPRGAMGDWLVTLRSGAVRGTRTSTRRGCCGPRRARAPTGRARSARRPSCAGVGRGRCTCTHVHAALCEFVRGLFSLNCGFLPRSCVCACALAILGCLFSRLAALGLLLR